MEAIYKAEETNVKAEGMIREIVEELFECAVGVVRDKGGRLPKDRAVEGSVLDIRGGGGESKVVGEKEKGKEKFKAEKGKFIDQKFDYVGRGRGKGVCKL